MKQLDLFQPPPLDNLERTIRRGKNNIATTSVLSYRKEKEKGTFSVLESKILNQLADGIPKNRRQLACALRKEPSSLCAAMKGLEKGGEIHVSHVGECPVTGNTVRFYRKGNGND